MRSLTLAEFMALKRHPVKPPFFSILDVPKAKPRRAVARFTPEAEAQRRTLGPRLPHHRHRMTADEALAGIILWLVIVASAIYVGAVYL